MSHVTIMGILGGSCDCVYSPQDVMLPVTGKSYEEEIHKLEVN